MAITKKQRKRLRRDDDATSASVLPQSDPRDAGVSDPFMCRAHRRRPIRAPYGRALLRSR
jgi:hypothetical protein